MRKKTIAISVACMFLGFIALPLLLADLVSVAPVDIAGTRVSPGAVHTERYTWQVLDTTSSTGDEPTDLAVGERTYQGVKTAIAAAVGGDGEISVFDIPRGWNGIRLRAIGITNNGTATYSIYSGTLGKTDASGTANDCELKYVGSFAFVIGTQASTTATYELADQLVVTSSYWPSGVTVVNPGTETERVAEAAFDLLGDDILVLVATTASADCKLLGKGY
jgi:hypothetical protein